MGLKKFLKPTKLSIIIFIVLAIPFISFSLFFYLQGICTDLSGFFTPEQALQHNVEERRCIFNFFLIFTIIPLVLLYLLVSTIFYFKKFKTKKV
mgnify:CR=1 FL=1